MSRDSRYSAAAYARVLSGTAEGVGSIADLIASAQRVSGTRFTADQLVARRAPRDLYRIYDAVIETLDAPGVDSVAAPISSITTLPGYTEFRSIASSEPIAKLKVAFLLAAAYRASDRGFTDRKGAAFGAAALSLAEAGRHQGEEQGSARIINGITDIYAGGLDVFKANAGTISNLAVRTEIERALRAGTDSSAVRQAVSRSQDSAAALREAKEDIESEEMKDSFFQNLFAEGGSTARWAIGATALSVVAIAALVMYRKRQDGSRQNPGQAGGVSSFYSEDQHSLPPAAEEQRKRVFAAMQKHRTSDGT
jgi:hypothetical protein